MLYTRHVNPESVLNTLNLNIASHNPVSERAIMEIYLTMLNYPEFLPPTAFPVDYMDGFCEVPDRYWIKTSTRRICIFTKYDPDSVTQRFVWHTEGQPNDIVVTCDVEADSIIFLEVQGTRLSYDNDKLLFIECDKTSYVHPIDIVFTDNFGLVQSTPIEIGAFSCSDETNGTFKSISGEISYDIEKIPYNALTVGDSAIPRQLQQFYSGMVNSRIYKVLLPGADQYGFARSIDCGMKDISLTADSFLKNYAITGVLSFNSADMPKITTEFGEIVIAD